MKKPIKLSVSARLRFDDGEDSMSDEQAVLEEPVPSMAELRAQMDEVRRMFEESALARQNPEIARLLKQVKKLSVPTRFYRFFFWTPDLCIGLSTPFKLFSRSRYMIKIGAKTGIMQFKVGWLMFSVRW